MDGLERFIEAQEQDYPLALEEMKHGKKESHWIWYIFPQLKGLGFSYYANYYGLDGIEAAIAYFENPYLRNHLLEITKVLLQNPEMDIQKIFDSPDDLKVKSSMTLFWLATQEEIFEQVLEKYYNGKMDSYTLEKVK